MCHVLRFKSTLHVDRKLQDCDWNSVSQGQPRVALGFLPRDVWFRGTNPWWRRCLSSTKEYHSLQENYQRSETEKCTSREGTPLPPDGAGQCVRGILRNCDKGNGACLTTPHGWVSVALWSWKNIVFRLNSREVDQQLTIHCRSGGGGCSPADEKTDPTVTEISSLRAKNQDKGCLPGCVGMWTVLQFTNQKWPRQGNLRTSGK